MDHGNCPAQDGRSVEMEASGESYDEDRKGARGAKDVSEADPRGMSWDEVEARFRRLCEIELHLDEEASFKALRLLLQNKNLLLADIGSTDTPGTVGETQRLWSAWIIFIVRRLGGETSPGAGGRMEKSRRGCTLSQILKVTKLSLLDFFKDLPQALVKVGPSVKTAYGDDWEKRLMVKEVQVDFYYLTVLFSYYKRLYQSFFLSVDLNCTSRSTLTSRASERSESCIYLRFGWLLFLLLRMRVLRQFADLVTNVNGLLAVFIVMVVHMPLSLRKFDLKDKSFFKERSANGLVKIRASICALYHDASENDVCNMVHKANGMISNVFRKNSGSGTRSRAQQLAGIDTDGLEYFEGLMNPRSVVFGLQTAEKHYEEVYHCRGGLDERLFFEGEEALTGTLSVGSSTKSRSKRKYETTNSPDQVTTGSCLSSPASEHSSAPNATSFVSNVDVPPTAVRVTLSTAKWLRTYISPLPSRPSLELQRFLQSCDWDISNQVINRAHAVFREIFSDGGCQSRDGCSTGSLDRMWVENRRLDSIKLYYRVLAAMCAAESRRLSSNNLTTLLISEKFHRCMIACSAELVFYTHKTVTMTFPAILRPAGISAFEFSRIIESFVRHEETLPRDLKRHLNSIEQQILESMAWEKGSSMYNTLLVAKNHLQPVIFRTCLVDERMLDHLSRDMQQTAGTSPDGSGISSQHLVASSHSNARGPHTPPNNVEETVDSLSIAKGLSSPFSVCDFHAKGQTHRALETILASPQNPSAHDAGERSAETVIGVFFSKVLKLAAVRIKDICERLQQSNQIFEQVYLAMKYILHKETSLLFNRHIDQLILCCVYGVCKVSNANVTFKTCIEHYGKPAQCKRQVFCNVMINSFRESEEGKGGGDEMGNIIKFYNEVFVPATKPYLVQLGKTIPRQLPLASTQ